MDSQLLTPSELLVPLVHGLPPWLLFSMLAGVAAASGFFLFLGRGFRSLPTYLLLGVSVAPLIQLAGADLLTLPPPLKIGEVQLLLVVLGTWAMLSIARVLRL